MSILISCARHRPLRAHHEGEKSSTPSPETEFKNNLDAREKTRLMSRLVNKCPNIHQGFLTYLFENDNNSYVIINDHSNQNTGGFLVYNEEESTRENPKTYHLSLICAPNEGKILMKKFLERIISTQEDFDVKLEALYNQSGAKTDFKYNRLIIWYLKQGFILDGNTVEDKGTKRRLQPMILKVRNGEVQQSEELESATVIQSV